MEYLEAISDEERQRAFDFLHAPIHTEYPANYARLPRRLDMLSPAMFGLFGPVSSGKTALTSEIVRDHPNVHWVRELNLGLGTSFAATMQTYVLQTQIMKSVHEAHKAANSDSIILVERPGADDALAVLAGFGGAAEITKPIELEDLLDQSFGMTAFVLMPADLETAKVRRRLSKRAEASTFLTEEGYQQWQNSYHWWYGYYSQFLAPLGTGLLIVNPYLSLRRKKKLVYDYLKTAHSIASGNINWRNPINEAIIKNAEQAFMEANILRHRKRREP